jgi:hypothetical protein
LTENPNLKWKGGVRIFLLILPFLLHHSLNPKP